MSDVGRTIPAAFTGSCLPNVRFYERAANMFPGQSRGNYTARESACAHPSLLEFIMRLCCSVFLTFAACIPCVSAFGQFDGMLARVPRDANTLILIDAEKLFGTPVADLERWQAKRGAAFESGVSGLPPDAASVVMAARVEFELGGNDWESSLVQFPQRRDVTAVAQRFGGSIDSIDGRTAAAIPGDHFVVQISPSMIQALDDLRAKPSTSGVRTAGQVAMWFDRYTRKIDNLPLLNVDPTLLAYGSDVAAALRDANSALRNVGMRTSLRTVNNAAYGSGPQASCELRNESAVQPQFG